MAVAPTILLGVDRQGLGDALEGRRALRGVAEDPHDDAEQGPGAATGLGLQPGELLGDHAPSSPRAEFPVNLGPVCPWPWT